ncbi:MAG: U32 family peptidase C-terminal domain-containing protein [Microgenomates group bacterium]
MADILAGKITHYFDRIGVAVVEVLSPLKVGDQIKITGHGQEFTQTVQSMQIEHQPVNEADKGQTVGMKVDQPVKEGDEVYKVE